MTSEFAHKSVHYPDPHGPRPGMTPAGSYTPASLLKVPGPEQLKEEWIVGKGRRSYERFMPYLRRYAKVHDTTVASYEANEGELRWRQEPVGVCVGIPSGCRRELSHVSGLGRDLPHGKPRNGRAQPRRVVSHSRVEVGVFEMRISWELVATGGLEPPTSAL